MRFIGIALSKMLLKKEASSRFLFLLLTPLSCKNSSPCEKTAIVRDWGGSSYEPRLPANSGFHKEEEG